MTHRIKNIFSDTVCEISMLLIVGCMIGYSLPLKLYSEWTDFAIVSVVAGTAMLAIFTGRIASVLLFGKQIKIMPPGMLIATEGVTRLLSLVWLYIVTSSWACVTPFAILFIWMQFRLIQDIRNNQII